MTPNSPHWLRSSPTCRVEWRPSRWPLVAVGVLAVLAIVSLWASELGAWASMACTAGVLALAVHTLRRETRRRPRVLWLPGDGQPARIDGVVVEITGLLRRGPLWVLHLRGGGRRSPSALAWWPDTLDPGARRELALAVAALTAAPGTPSVAP